MTQTITAGSFEEIRQLLQELPGPDIGAEKAARDRQAQLTKPAGSLGRLEDLAIWMSAWQGRHPPRLERPHTAVFAANHGVAARGVSAYPAAVTAQMVQNFIAGGAAVNQLCAVADADLRVYEMALEKPTDDFTEGPAMSEEDCVRAMAYGMMAVEPGIDLLALGEMGIGNTTSASALSHALYGGSVGDWVGRGTGIDDSTLARKTEAVAKAVARHAESCGDPLAILAALGGRELAAVAGAILAARLAHIPVVLDGFACTVAGAVVQRLAPSAMDHCLVSHLSVEPGHSRLLAHLGQRPLLDLGMRLGEASGAMLAVLLLKAAIACHNGMATFEEAGVAGPGV